MIQLFHILLQKVPLRLLNHILIHSEDKWSKKLKYCKYYFSSISNQPSLAEIRRITIEQQNEQLKNIYVYPDNLDNALSLILQAISGESEDSVFYSYLIENSPTKEDKQIITGIRDNELNHYKIFRQIYYDITGIKIPAIELENFIQPSSYCEGLKNALIGEQKSIQSYRQILYAMQTPVHINMMIEIITDEIRHGSLYNYLYAKNECKV